MKSRGTRIGKTIRPGLTFTTGKSEARLASEKFFLKFNNVDNPEPSHKPIVETVEPSGSVQRVMVNTLEAVVDVGGVQHPIKVVVVPGATAGMHFEAYKGLERILMSSVSDQKARAFIDPIIQKAMPALRGGINGALITSIIQLFKATKVKEKLYHGKITVIGTSHLADLLREELAANKIHSAILMQYIKNNFMDIAGDFPELTELLMSVIGFGNDSQKPEKRSGKTFF